MGMMIVRHKVRDYGQWRPIFDRHADMQKGLDNGILTVEGKIDFGKYEGTQPVYSEYNIGPFRRSFRISSQIDQGKIKAEMRDGVITLTLPKAEQAKPRRIEVRTGQEYNRAP